MGDHHFRLEPAYLTQCWYAPNLPNSIPHPGELGSCDVLKIPILKFPGLAENGKRPCTSWPEFSGQLMSDGVFFCLLVFPASGMSPGWVSCQLINTETLFAAWVSAVCFSSIYTLFPSEPFPFPFSILVFRGGINPV